MVEQLCNASQGATLETDSAWKNASALATFWLTFTSLLIEVKIKPWC